MSIKENYVGWLLSIKKALNALRSLNKKEALELTNTYSELSKHLEESQTYKDLYEAERIKWKTLKDSLEEAYINHGFHHGAYDNSTVGIHLALKKIQEIEDK